MALLPLQSLAKTSGFVLRRPRKLSLEAFLQSILLGLGQPSDSLQSWAAQLSALQSVLFSKQALHRRGGSSLVHSPLKIAAYFSRLLPLITASPHQDWFEHFYYFCRYSLR